MRILLVALAVFCFARPAFASENIEIVTSIRPVYELVKTITAEHAKVELLLKGGMSPHGAKLKPSQIRAMNKADMIVMIDRHFEQFMARPLVQLGKETELVELLSATAPLEKREGGVWSVHSHDEHESHDGYQFSNEEDNENIDFHAWLSPDYTLVMAKKIVDELSSRLPELAPSFHENWQRLHDRMILANQQISESFAAVGTKNYLVFHDAYQYFEDHFGLQGVGSVTLEPDMPISAQRLYQLRQTIRDRNVACVFYEPQFSHKTLGPLVENLQVMMMSIDPLGNEVDDEDYFGALYNMIARSFRACFAKAN